MTDSILIHNCTLLSTPADHGRSATAPPLLPNAWLRTHGDTIVAMGDASDLTQTEINQATTIIDGQGQMLAPGLINAHNHCAMTLFRGLADDLELVQWLTNHIFPAEALHVNEAMVYHCSKLAAAEMILSGTTTVADGYFLEHQAAQAFVDSGIRAIAAQGSLTSPPPASPTRRKTWRRRPGFWTCGKADTRASRRPSSPIRPIPVPIKP